jgi:[ribosomal protein S5]-alanine N-acetyltransferase
MLFTSKRLYVRKFTSSDEDAFFRLNGDEEIMRFIRPVKSREESNAFLAENIRFYDAHPGLGRFALVEKDTDDVAGTFSLLPLEHTDDVHIGYALLKAHWGKGYASEIVKAGIDYAFNELKLSTLTAVTYAEHIQSQKVLLRNGFVEDGVYEEEGRKDLLFRIMKKA